MVDLLAGAFTLEEEFKREPNLSNIQKIKMLSSRSIDEAFREIELEISKIELNWKIKNPLIHTIFEKGLF